MKKKIILLCLLIISSIDVFSQINTITGKIIDRDTKEGVMMVTVQMLTQDSTYISGVLSDENGKFKLTAPKRGNYILKFTCVGYIPLTKTLNVSTEKNIALGDITFSADAIMLKGATVIGQAPPVTVQEDTFVYNASAYRTPEGSVVEELIKKLPGAQIDDDGKITINGKEVKKNTC